MLQRGRIEEHPTDLEDDKFDGHKVFDLIVFLAIMIYFTETFGEDVVKDPIRLLSAVRHNAGLTVLFYYALMHGNSVQVLLQKL